MVNQYLHSLLSEIDNCPSWISRRERMTLENILWSISTKECYQTWRGSNLWPPDHQSDTYPTEPPRPAELCLSLCCFDWLIVLGFNDTSTLVGHFVLSPREREKSDRRDSRGDERWGQGWMKNRNESKETEEMKTFPLYPYLLQG